MSSLKAGDPGSRARWKTVNLETNSSAQEIRVQTAEELGEEILFKLGLEKGNKAMIWIYRDDSGGLYISGAERQGIRKIMFTRRGKES
jgi:hypothetical protein